MLFQIQRLHNIEICEVITNGESEEPASVIIAVVLLAWEVGAPVRRWTGLLVGYVNRVSQE
jgi:hypothetical protein